MQQYSTCEIMTACYARFLKFVFTCIAHLSTVLCVHPDSFCGFCVELCNCLSGVFLSLSSFYKQIYIFLYFSGIVFSL